MEFGEAHQAGVGKIHRGIRIFFQEEPDFGGMVMERELVLTPGDLRHLDSADLDRQRRRGFRIVFFGGK